MPSKLKWIQVAPEVEVLLVSAQVAYGRYKQAVAQDEAVAKTNISGPPFVRLAYSFWPMARLALTKLGEAILGAPIAEFGSNEPEDGCVCHEIGSRCCDLHNGNKETS